MFLHYGSMVSPPKSLSDLHRIDAAVRIRCRICETTVDRDLADLLAEVGELGGTTSWPEFLHGMHCSNTRCGSEALAALPVPFTAGTKRRQSPEVVLLNLALKLLKTAAWRRHDEPVATLDVRLALRVLQLYLRDPAPLTAFWTMANLEPKHPWQSCRQPYDGIVAWLIARGHVIWSENRH